MDDEGDISRDNVRHESTRLDSSILTDSQNSNISQSQDPGEPASKKLKVKMKFSFSKEKKK